MSALTLPYSAAANTVAPSASYNANNTAIVNWSTTIDHSNTTGSTGFWASDIKPLTAGAATFGLTATGVGYKFLANDTTATPLTVSGVTSQSVDYFDITATSGGQKLLQLGSTGQLAVLGASGSSLVVSALTAVSNAGNTAGDIAAQRDASSGALFLGGATHHGSLDYGATTALMFTLTGGAFNVGLGAGNGGATSIGDLSVARSTSVGFMALGGSVSAGSMDYNSSTTNQMTFFRFVSGSASAFLQLTAAAYNIGSDAALKTNVQPIAYGLATVNALKPSSFTWVDDKADDFGFIAQDVQAVMPEIVASSKMDGKKLLTIKPLAITAATVKAIQELDAKFEAYVAAHP